jgi:hypothetical protein
MMQIPMDEVLDGMGFDAMGQWHKGAFLDFWRWSFADLRDDEEKSIAAEAITKMLLGMGPATITTEEMQFLRISSTMATQALPAIDPGRGFDA